MDNQNYLIPLAIVVAGIIIGGGIFLGAHNKSVSIEKANMGTASAITSVRKIDPSTDHILGSPDAKIMLVEYSDLECPFCKQFQSTLHQVMQNYGSSGKVAWVYRSFPIAELHPKAENEAEAAECANEVGGPNKFWAFIDKVYAVTPSNNGLDPAQLPVIAGGVGIDVSRFNICLSSGKYKDKVAADYQDAVSAGGQGTPFTVLVTAKGNFPISDGAIPYDQLKQKIDQILANL
jgi:protein-disulfide isomerase